MTINPEYNCDRILGEGAFGQVWECKTPISEPFAKNHPKVALKVIKNPGWGSAAEVNVLKGLAHKYVKNLNCFQVLPQIYLFYFFPATLCDFCMLFIAKLEHSASLWSIVTEVA